MVVGLSAGFFVWRTHFCEIFPPDWGMEFDHNKQIPWAVCLGGILVLGID